ncbi:MAG TPA: SDR family oxidoreductase [Myxococcota bacterium]|jgi:NAD(P)-dependent dehydrogenase (short-subunit alcohol dehydrogenase family)
MKMRHPLTGAIYERLEGGRCRVTEADGRSGVFTDNGRWLSGDLRDADLHMLNWVGGPQLESRDAGPTGVRAPSAAVPAAPARPASAGASAKGKGMELGLSGKRALITAASRGIGLAIARQFADDGCAVAICARSEGGLETARKELEQRGVAVFARAVDVSDGAALRAFVAEAAGALGGLDVFVSNASGGGGMGEPAWQATFEIDVMSAARGVEAALPFLVQSDAASVVFISSTAALEYLGVPQPYNAMKAALIAHAGDLAQALAKQGIRVNTVSPGPIYFEGGNWEMLKNAMPAVYQGALAQCAIGRMGTPEEVARAVVFLASPAASLITGANLVCDGGFTKGHHF